MPQPPTEPPRPVPGGEHGDGEEGFGALVRACRIRAHLSQEALAERAGVSDRSVRNLERGRVRSPRPETAHLLGVALGLVGPELDGFLARARSSYWTSRADGVASPILADGPPAPRPPAARLDQVPVRLLGPVRLHLAPRPGQAPPPSGTIASGQARAVLASLVFRISDFVPDDQIVDEVWGENPPTSAHRTVRAHVSLISRVLEGSGAALSVDRTQNRSRILGRREHVDWYLFEEMVTQARGAARRGDHRAARSTFVNALDLWQGPGLADLPLTPIRTLFAPVMEASRRAALADRIDADLQLGDVDLVPELTTLYAQDPDNDRLLGQLVQALQQTGRRDEAETLSARRHRPAPVLAARDHRRQRPHRCTPRNGGPASTVPEPPSRPAPLPRVPGWAGGFVGRERELTELRHLLDRERLVTVVGPPGVGKSRLVWEVVGKTGRNGPDDLRAASPGDVWVAGLGDVGDPELAIQTVAQVVGAARSPHRDPTEVVSAHLSGREALLVLDDCDHLVAWCADLVAELLRRHPLLRVLVTSREPLMLPVETIYSLHPLPVPDEDTTAITDLTRIASMALFCQRARQVQPAFGLDADIAPTVASICRAVDGLPLALELASARVGVLSGPELVARLNDQLTVLSRHGGRARDRHVSLRAAMDTSLALLEAPEAAVFARLSVFAGRFTLDAVEAVVPPSPQGPPTLDLVHALVNKSLVVADLSGDPTRFRLLEPVRQYAAALLGAEDTRETRRRHTRHLIEMARQAARDRHTSRRGHWLRFLDAEHSNLTAALDTAVRDRCPDTALELSSLLWWWWFNAPREGLDWYRRILAVADPAAVDPDPTVPPAPRAPDAGPPGPGRATAQLLLDTLLSAAVIASFLNPHEAMGYARRARATAAALGDTFGTVRALHHISDIAYELGDLVLARQAGAEALDLAEELGGYALARCQLTAAYNHLSGLDIEAATRAARQAAVSFTRIEDEEGRADADLALAEIALLTGRAADAVPVLEGALSTYRHLDSQENVARTATLLATSLAEAEDHPGCLRLVREACDIHTTIRHPWTIANDLDFIASIASTWHQHAVAATLLAAADSVRSREGLTPTPRNRHVREPIEQAAVQALGAHTYRVAYRSGTTTDLGSALAIAHNLTGRPPAG